jgi:8-oxo-dGTP diphosphatase
MSGPSGSALVVVGAAIFDAAGRLLAAQRAAPARYAGLWEFPGGKVEAGETPTGALARECREELGIDIEVGAPVGEVEIDIGVLQVYRASIISGRPVASEHQALRWLAAHELDEVDWIAADRPLVQRLHDQRTHDHGLGPVKRPKP